MADTVKKLAAVKPLATTLTASGAVPAAKGWMITTIVVNNGGSTDAQYRVSHAVAAAADADAQYLYGSTTRGPTIRSDSTWVFTIGASAAATDVFRFYSDTGNVVFVLYGTERDQ